MFAKALSEWINSAAGDDATERTCSCRTRRIQVAAGEQTTLPQLLFTVLVPTRRRTIWYVSAQVPQPIADQSTACPNRHCLSHPRVHPGRPDRRWWYNWLYPHWICTKHCCRPHSRSTGTLISLQTSSGPLTSSSMASVATAFTPKRRTVLSWRSWLPSFSPAAAFQEPSSLASRYHGV